MIKVLSNTPMNDSQKTMIAIRKAIAEKSGNITYKSSLVHSGLIEVVINLIHDDVSNDFVGREMMNMSSKAEAVESAELKAYCMIMEYLSIEYELQSIIPQITRVAVDWDRKTIMEYADKGIDVLLYDMGKSGYDISPIIEYRDDLPKNSRLTVKKLADKFFPTSADTTVIISEQKTEIGKPVLVRMKEPRQNWVDLLSDLRDSGFTEEKFNSMNLTEFKGLIDFAKFATDAMVENTIQRAV